MVCYLTKTCKKIIVCKMTESLLLNKPSVFSVNIIVLQAFWNLNNVRGNFVKLIQFTPRKTQFADLFFYNSLTTYETNLVKSSLIHPSGAQ